MFDTITPPDQARALGRRVAALRLQRNITQSQLAERAGISRATLGALETRGKGTLENLARVLYALGRERELEAIAAPDPPSTLDEVLTPRRRKRARP